MFIKNRQDSCGQRERSVPGGGYDRKLWWCRQHGSNRQRSESLFFFFTPSVAPLGFSPGNFPLVSRGSRCRADVSALCAHRRCRHVNTRVSRVYLTLRERLTFLCDKSKRGRRDASFLEFRCEMSRRTSVQVASFLGHARPGNTWKIPFD